MAELEFWPTPEEFCRFWDKLTPERKIEKAKTLIRALRHCTECPLVPAKMEIIDG